MRYAGNKRLILNADDFGLHASINEAVEKAHVLGVLTSASLVPNGDCFHGAVEIAKRNSRLGIGIHITLVGEKPVSPRDSVASILGKDGMLLPGYAALLGRLMRGEARPEHITAECEAQVLKFIGAGLVPTHADSHQHLHLFAPIMKAIDPVLRKYGVRKVRSLNVPWSDFRKADMARVAFSLYNKCGNRLMRYGYKSPDRFFGFFKSGGTDVRYVREVLSALKPGVTEIALHPGMDNDAIRKKYGFWRKRTGWGYDWYSEYGLLVDPGIRGIIDSHGIKLINYGEI
jgi:predicted glycoside hydrolase/deacetylase ChbG (UPF0249 family)